MAAEKNRGRGRKDRNSLEKNIIDIEIVTHN